jgi:hypothetical protein
MSVITSLEPVDLSIDMIDLKNVARILHDVYPGYSLCECARMAAAFAPDGAAKCTLCRSGTFPDCLRRDEQPDGVARAG